MQSSNRVGIFWDYDTCQVPGASGYAVVNSLRTCAQKFGEIQLFKAYLDVSEQPADLRSELQLSGVSLTDAPRNGIRSVAQAMMNVELLLHALDGRSESATTVIVSGDRSFSYAVAMMRFRSCKIVVISPSDIIANASVSFDWHVVVKDLLRDASSEQARDNVSIPHQSPITQAPPPGGSHFPPPNDHIRRVETPQRPSSLSSRSSTSLEDVAETGPRPRSASFSFPSASVNSAPSSPSSAAIILERSSMTTSISSLSRSAPSSPNVVPPTPLTTSSPPPPAPESVSALLAPALPGPAGASTSVAAHDPPAPSAPISAPAPPPPVTLLPPPIPLRVSKPSPSPAPRPASAPVPVASTSTTPRAVPPRFHPLVSLLNKLRAQGKPRIDRSILGSSLSPNIYKQAGVKKLKDYLDLAVQAGIVDTFGNGNSASVSLRPEWRA